MDGPYISLIRKVTLSCCEIKKKNEASASQTRAPRVPYKLIAISYSIAASFQDIRKIVNLVTNKIGTAHRGRKTLQRYTYIHNINLATQSLRKIYLGSNSS